LSAWEAGGSLHCDGYNPGRLRVLIGASTTRSMMHASTCIKVFTRTPRRNFTSLSLPLVIVGMINPGKLAMLIPGTGN